MTVYTQQIKHFTQPVVEELKIPVQNSTNIYTVGQKNI